LEYFCGDVVEAIQEAQALKLISRDVNSTFLSLVPKVGDPKAFGDFRIISLCNTLNKILSKTMSYRIKGILPCIINHD